MFTSHFQMESHPFAETIPADRILPDERMSEGLARFSFLAAEGVVGVLFGRTGVGKSSLIRLFVQSLSRTRYLPVYLHLTHLDAGALLRLIVTGLGEAPRRGKERLFMQILERAKREKATPLLIVDDAHLLAPEALVDLRLLASAGMDSPPMKILLSGQEGLKDRLKQDRHADLANRVSVSHALHPLTRSQTAAYIDHRMRGAKASERIFEDEAKALIHEFAAGIPRQINNAATVCLMQAASQNVKRVTVDIVNASMNDLPLA